MPYFSLSFWSTVYTYLPEKEKETASMAVAQLEKESSTNTQKEKAARIYYPKITRSQQLSFIYFNSLIHQTRKLPFKFHISVSSHDYERVLYTSDLNKMLQQNLIVSSHQKALSSFKYVDPTLLKQAQIREAECYKHLVAFYNKVLRHNALEAQQYEEKFRLFHIIKPWHQWFVNTLGSEFPQLNSLLEASLSELEQFKKKSFSLLQEIMTSSERLENCVQLTLYVCEGASSESLISLIQNVSSYLSTMRISTVPCPDSDLPLTEYVSFRQDRFYIDGEYIEADDAQSIKLKELASDNDLYKELHSGLLETPCELKPI